jgi:hypothetical protein
MHKFMIAWIYLLWFLKALHSLSIIVIVTI